MRHLLGLLLATALLGRWLTLKPEQIAATPAPYPTLLNGIGLGMTKAQALAIQPMLQAHGHKAIWMESAPGCREMDVEFDVMDRVKSISTLNCGTLRTYSGHTLD